MNRPEEQVHRACVELLQVYRARGSLAFCHPYNGGRRTPAEAGVGKALGVVPGVPDLLLWFRGGGHAQVELKAPLAKRRLSPAQVDWVRAMLDMGTAVHVVRSVDDLEAVLRQCGVPPVGKLSPEAAGRLQDGRERSAASQGQKSAPAHTAPLQRPYGGNP